MKRVPAFAIILLAVGIQSARSQNTLLLKVEGIQGEAVVQGYQDWITALGFTHGTLPAGTTGGSGHATSGENGFPVFTVSKNVDKSSPSLNESCAAGKHIQEVTLVSLKTLPHGGTSYVQYRITLREAAVQSVHVKGDVRSLTEDIAFSFSSIRWEYTPLDRNGRPGSTISKEFDVSRPG